MSGTASNYMAGNLGIGVLSSTSANISLNVGRAMTGGSIFWGVNNFGTVQSDVANPTYYRSSLSTAAASFAVGSAVHYVANQGTIGAGSTVTGQYAYVADGTLTGAASNFAFAGQIPAGTNNWNLYASGSAPNHMAGSLGIGTTSVGSTSGVNLRVSKNLTGAVSSYGMLMEGNVASDVTATARAFCTNISVAAATFTLGELSHYTATATAFGAGSTVTSHIGLNIGGLSGGVNNYGIRSGVAAAATSWNIFAQGTARNYMLGALSIGGTVDPGTGGLYVAGPVVMVPPVSVTPNNNGEMVFQLTSNTSLVIKVKGSDGVVRSATLTLA
jgi:hypothetical protein